MPENPKFHNIRWKKSDLIELRKAVNNFNSKIDRLNRESVKEYLPEKYNYKELKKNIKTRDTLNEYIKSLKKFTKYGKPELTQNEQGLVITKWEYQEMKKMRNRQLKSLSIELKEFESPENKKLKPYTSQQEDNLKAQIKNLKKLEVAKERGELNRLIRRIRNVGTKDYELRKAIIYRDNWLNTMKKYKNFKGYKELRKKLENIKDPIEFYKFVSNIENENSKDLTYQSDQFFTNEEFIIFIKDFGINFET